MKFEVETEGWVINHQFSIVKFQAIEINQLSIRVQELLITQLAQIVKAQLLVIVQLARDKLQLIDIVVLVIVQLIILKLSLILILVIEIDHQLIPKLPQFTNKEEELRVHQVIARAQLIDIEVVEVIVQLLTLKFHHIFRVGLVIVEEVVFKSPLVVKEEEDIVEEVVFKAHQTDTFVLVRLLELVKVVSHWISVGQLTVNLQLFNIKAQLTVSLVLLKFKNQLFLILKG